MPAQSRTGPGSVKLVFMRACAGTFARMDRMASNGFDGRRDEAGGSMPDGSAQVDHAALLRQTPRSSSARLPAAYQAARRWKPNGDTRHHFKVFKRVEEVVPDDLPPIWLKN